MQAHNVYPQLLLGRLLFSLGAAAASTMVTAVLPTVTSSPTQGESATTAASHHVQASSIASEATITPTNYGAAQTKADPKARTSTSAYASSSRVAGFVGMFTGCGALIALLVLLPLPARFQKSGVSPENALQYSFYIVAAIAFLLAIWCFVGLRKLPQDKTRLDVKAGRSLGGQVAAVWHSLVDALDAGFTRSDITLGYMGGFVARASSVGISLFIPLLVNAAFLESHLCNEHSVPTNSEGLPSLKRKCPQAYLLAAAMTGVCETVALIAAPIFGWAASKSSRRGLPLMVASVAGIMGYILFPTQFDPDSSERGKRALAFVAVCLIGISQIGTIVCSLGLLSSGILSSMEEHVETANDSERETLLTTSTSKTQPTLSHLQGSIAGIYSFYGGAAILILTKLGGSLFDKVATGAPFYIMAAFNGILFIACAVFGLRKTISTS